jgi:hypothetical protein
MHKVSWFDTQTICFPLMLKQTINIVCLKDIVSKRNMDSFASSAGLGNCDLANESLHIKSF